MALTWSAERALFSTVVEAVPGILESQKANGEFGTEPWIPGDQNVLLALAAAWSLEGSSWRHDGKVLEAIVRGGDALIHQADAQGRWMNRKKDGSTWGPRHMTWTYSRWMRAYALCREAFPEDARRRWDEALVLGYDEIRKIHLRAVHNQAAHYAMGLFCAGEVFGRAEWKEQARNFVRTVAEAQSPHGWWAEHKGPVISYNYVYMEALGVYYAMSGDEGVLGALERGARYHANFTYPDGSAVETVDGRNPYHAGVRLGNPGFSHTAAGRGYLLNQHRRFLEAGRSFGSDYAANMLLYAGSGPAEMGAGDRERSLYRMGEEAAVLRKKPWFVCVSALTGEPPAVRWGQDRQNFLSVYHDRAGLILGGGNTKLQPLWSTFTVGDVSLLKHTPGDEDPDFGPREGLFHVPDRAAYEVDEDGLRLRSEYGPETCTVSAAPVDDSRLRIVLESTGRSGMPVEAHLTFLPALDREVALGSGATFRLEAEPVERSGRDAGGWMAHAGWRVSVPEGGRIVWPALPHNPYRKGGEAGIEEARLVLALPFGGGTSRYELVLEVLPGGVG